MNYKISSAFYSKRNTMYLKPTTWDDYGIKTCFIATYVDEDGSLIELGMLKIAKRNLSDGCTKDYLENEFTKLNEDFFSLWQSAESYKMIYDLNNRASINIFEDLNDIAYNLELFEYHKEEKIFKLSLLREVSFHSVIKQFNRIAHGSAVLTPYKFNYTISQPQEDLNLEFEVNPESFPPTNVHAIIGSNGSGKTTIIKDMIKSICEVNNTIGHFQYHENDSWDDELGYFESILCISFSPFDDYSEVTTLDKCNEKCTFIGVRKLDISNLLSDIQKEFIDSYVLCQNNQDKKRDLKELLEDLDILQQNVGINKGFEENYENGCESNLLHNIESEFSRLSSGQKVVLSIVTRAIANLAEKSILFLDEPENHLHPPLLSSLIRSLSKMVIKRNSVAIISTHSPIVLQEVPRSNVWIIGRSNNILYSERPRIETFGANVGLLTNEVFDYEVKNTGFNKLLRRVVEKCDTYEEVLEKFNNQLGNEAKSIVRMLITKKEKKNAEN